MVDAFRSRRRTIINTAPADYETLDLQCSDVVDRFQATAAELAAGKNRNTSDPQKDTVLEGSLVSMITPRMVTYAALR